MAASLLTLTMAYTLAASPSFPPYPSVPLSLLSFPHGIKLLSQRSPSIEIIPQRCHPASRWATLTALT